MRIFKPIALSIAVCSLAFTGAQAAVTQVEGQAGGGIVPWGLLSGGPTVSTTWVDTGEYTLSSTALQTSFAKWVEVSYAKMTFDPGTPHPVGHIDLDVFGAKLRLLEMSDTMPALALGVQYKKQNGSTGLNGILEAMGADDSGVDIYLAATKIIPVAGKKLLLNGTIRATKANQIGILGFGSSSDDSYQAQFEGSIGVFLNEKTVLGIEYRMKPDNQLTCKSEYEACPGDFTWNEDDWSDLFFAYFPTPNMAIVFAAAIFGDVAPVANQHSGYKGNDQRGIYLQVQASF